MTVPILPQGSEPLRKFLTELERQVQALQQPNQPGAVYACVKLKLPPAANFINCTARVTDTNILVASDGVHWIRQDTGAPI